MPWIAGSAAIRRQEWKKKNGPGTSPCGSKRDHWTPVDMDSPLGSPQKMAAVQEERTGELTLIANEGSEASGPWGTGRVCGLGRQQPTRAVLNGQSAH